MKFLTITIFIVICLLGSGNILAVNDDPAEILKTASDGENISESKLSVNDRWKVFLEARNWGDVRHEGGVMIFPDRDLYISSASVFTNVNIGQPGWVESRVVAFEKAELDAKAKIIRTLAETASSKRSVDMFEKAAWSDGSIEEVKKLGEVAEVLAKIGKKTLALGDATLDSALRNLDPDYDPSDYENKTPEQVEKIMEDKFSWQIRSMSFRISIGVTPIYTTEGAIDGQYQVLVGVVWSPKLNRLAMSLFNDEYNIPPVTPGRKIKQQIPDNEMTLLGTFGTRIVVDENGEYSVLSYAQAQPRRSSPGRLQSALQLAKQIAAERARAQIVNFIREGISFDAGESSRELFREFSDMTSGTEILREFQKKIKSSKTTINLHGLRVAKEWSVKHPETGQNVAGAVVVWTPSGDRMSKKMDQVMKSRSTEEKTKQKEQKKSETPDDVLESMPIDTSAY